MPQLDVTTYTSQVFWLFICFSILYLTLKYQIIPKLEQIRQNRWNHIEGAQEEAKLLRDNAESIKTQCNTSMTKAKNLALETIDNVSKKTKSQIDKERNKFIRESLEKISIFKVKMKQEEKNNEDILPEKVNSLIINLVTKVSKNAIDQNVIEKALNNQTFLNHSNSQSPKNQ